MRLLSKLAVVLLHIFVKLSTGYNSCFCNVWSSYGIKVSLTPGFCPISSDSAITAEYTNQTLPISQIYESERIKEVMKKSIMWYKSTLSPIMPPNCRSANNFYTALRWFINFAYRFLPTCSSYGLEAIEKYGSWRGGLLIGWRIFRCNPTGGSGYDPPIWPPPGYFAGSNTKLF
jgi:putative membrane protein insertion efficiency factor